MLSLNFPYEERLYPGVYLPERETIQYWPTTPGSTLMFMPFKVTCLSSLLKVNDSITIKVERREREKKRDIPYLSIL